MKTLYIHGLESYPKPEKVKIMENAGLEVIAIHLHYKNQPDAYELLKIESLRNHVEFIVGSSFGGYLGYWLAEDLGIPCLLFNPAIQLGSRIDVTVPRIRDLMCRERYVVIGSKDEIVNPKFNEVFFSRQERSGLIQKVIICQWLAHQVDEETFEEMVRWAVGSRQSLSREAI